jgi:hypothetical protein
MMHIIYVQQITTFLHMIGSTEQDVDFFKGDLFRFRDEKPYVEREEYVDSEEEVECFARGSRES